MTAGRFVSRATVRIWEDEKNTSGNYMDIKPKMGIAEQAIADDALYGIDETGKPSLTMGRHQLALIRVNLVGWGGPDYKDMPFTPANIDALDPDDPFHKRVFGEIGERNKERKSPDPKSDAGSAPAEPSTAPTTTGSMSAGASSSTAD